MNLKLGLVLASLSIGLGAQQKVIDKEFLFRDGTLTSTDGTVTLTDISYSGEHRDNKFEKVTVEVLPSVASPGCNIMDRDVYYTKKGSGLVFNAGPASDYSDGNEYSVIFVFQFDRDKTKRWERIIDFSNGTVDSGIYRFNDVDIDFYVNTKVNNVPGVLAETVEKYTLFTMTRSKEGNVKIYINRNEVARFNDTKGTYRINSLGNIILFKDDNNRQATRRNEDASARTAYLRVTNYELPPNEIVNIYDSLCEKLQEDPATPPRTSSPCYKPANSSGTALDTPVGITALGRAGEDWPAQRKGAHLALEAKTKGFVLNRVSFSNDKPAGIPEGDYTEGMMVYDTTNNCLRMYTSKDNGATFGWYCINTQACPD